MYTGISSEVKEEFSANSLREWATSLRDLMDSSIRLVKGPPARMEIKPGVYSVYDQDKGKSLAPVNMDHRDLIFVKTESTMRVAKEFDNFLSKKEELLSRGFQNKRGIILHGAPGTGKSSLLYRIALEMAERGTIVLICNSSYEVRQADAIIKEYVHGQNTMIILEDIDESIGEYGVHALLQTMDGLSSKSDTIFVATTNDINTVPKKLLRPGRFDIKVEIGNPEGKDRFEFLKHKFKDKEVAEAIARKTKSFSYAELAEIVKGVTAYGEPAAEVISRIKEDRKMGASKSEASALLSKKRDR